MRTCPEFLVVGLTGGVGTGKSTVAQCFDKLGAAVIDTDAIVHALIEPGKPAWREIEKLFGKSVIGADGCIRRSVLAAKVFRSPAARKRLEQVLHPRVKREVQRQLRLLRRQGKARVAVVEVPLLFESGMDKGMDTVVVVTARRSVQLERLWKKHGWSQKEAQARIQAQWTQSAKVALADHVIDNDGSVSNTRQQVRVLWNKLVRPTQARSKQSSISLR